MAGSDSLLIVPSVPTMAQYEDPRFADLPADTGLFVCEKCSNVVADRGVHVRWHREVAEMLVWLVNDVQRRVDEIHKLVEGKR